ncbi:extracellular solute-binding protein [Alicyclobacillus curvatus]|nr:extracellular solute-binding protein [Alicyclobacillus curvatus]
MKKSKKSVIVAVSVALAMSPLLVACGNSNGNTGNSSASSGSKVTNITFWSFWGSSTRRPVIQAMVNQFNQTHPDIHVTYQYLPWGDVWTKELAGVAAGNPPDVIIQDINSVQSRAQKKQAMDLSPYLKQDNIKNDFFSSLWDSVTYNGDVYGIPFNTDTRLLFYNKDMFKAAGLNPNNPPQTWAQLDADAQKLNQKSGNGYKVIGFYPLWGDFGADSWLLNADNGVSYLNYKTKQADINTPNKLAALNWINGYTQQLGQKTVEQFQASFGSKQQDPFLSGKVAMMMENANFYTQIQQYAPNLNFGVAQVPSFKQGTGHWSWGGGFDVEIPVGSKHPSQAWQFVKFLTSQKEQEYWAAREFDLVANKQAASAAAKDSLLKPAGQMVYQAMVDNMKWTVHTPVPVWAPGYPNLVEPHIQAATSGQGSPQKELQSAQKAIQDLIAQNSQ